VRTMPRQRVTKAWCVIEAGIGRMGGKLDGRARVAETSIGKVALKGREGRCG
jgi:hypothetical protein